MARNTTHWRVPLSLVIYFAPAMGHEPFAPVMGHEPPTRTAVASAGSGVFLLAMLLMRRAYTIVEASLENVSNYSGEES